MDTETSDFNGCVLELGAVLANDAGTELASYDRLWQLPRGERVSSFAYRAHGISTRQVQREGVPALPELKALQALLAACERESIKIVFHNKVFDVARLKHSAKVHGLSGDLSLDSAFCTMQAARPKCDLRDARGATKAPRNEELYRFLFGQAPQARLHRAVADARVTLASFIEGRKREWW
eukprot:1139035-Prymnesium_polylepis.1